VILANGEGEEEDRALKVRTRLPQKREGFKGRPDALKKEKRFQISRTKKKSEAGCIKYLTTILYLGSSQASKRKVDLKRKNKGKERKHHPM